MQSAYVKYRFFLTVTPTADSASPAYLATIESEGGAGTAETVSKLGGEKNILSKTRLETIFSLRSIAATSPKKHRIFVLLSFETVSARPAIARKMQPESSMDVICLRESQFFIAVSPTAGPAVPPPP